MKLKLQQLNTMHAKQTLASLDDKQHKDKLLAYYDLGLKCIERSFEMLGIKYLF